MKFSGADAIGALPVRRAVKSTPRASAQVAPARKMAATAPASTKAADAAKKTAAANAVRGASAKAQSAAQRLVDAGNRFKVRSGRADLGSKAAAKGRAALSKAVARASAAKQQILGVIVGDYAMTATNIVTSAVEELQILQRVFDELNAMSNVANAVAAMVNAANAMSPLIDSVTAAGQTSLAQQGNSLYNQAGTVVDAYDPNQDPPDTSLIGRAGTVQGNIAAWSQQAQAALSAPAAAPTSPSAAASAASPGDASAPGGGAGDAGGGGEGSPDEGVDWGEDRGDGGEALEPPPPVQPAYEEPAYEEAPDEAPEGDEGDMSQQDDDGALEVAGQALVDVGAHLSTSVLGLDVLGADVTIPKEGVVYTDYDTVLAVQKALEAKGFHLKKGVDGKYGSDTAQAIRAMQKSLGNPETGVIDAGVLMALQVRPSSTGSSPSPSAPATPSASPSYASLFSQATPAAPGAPPAAAGFWSQPLWEGAPVKRWQGAVGTVGFIGIGVGIWMAVRR